MGEDTSHWVHAMTYCGCDKVIEVELVFCERHQDNFQQSYEKQAEAHTNVLDTILEQDLMVRKKY